MVGRTSNGPDVAGKKHYRFDSFLALHRDLQKIESKLDLIYEDKLSGTISLGFWKRKHEEYSARLNLIRGEIKSTE